jgi:hypothetical protein
MIGDDVISAVESLALVKQDDGSKTQTTTDISTDATPEGFAKAVNPDGKATLEDQVANAQKLLGRHSNTVGTLRGALKNISSHIKFDEATGKITDVDLMGFADAIGPEAVSRKLAAVGLKVVPLNGTAPTDEDSIIAQILGDEGKDKTPEERREEINSSPTLAAELAVAKREHVSRAKQAAENALATEQREVDDFIAKVSKQPDYDKVRPLMAKMHEQIPLDRPLTGEGRMKILYAMAQLSIQGERMRKLRDDAIKYGEERALKNFEASGMPSGGVGTHVNMAGGGSRDGEAVVPAEMTKEVSAAVL